VPHAIEILRSADKFLTKLSKQQPADAEAIEDAIENLGEHPRPHGSTALKGYTGIWRIRVGNYRICYQAEDQQLLILVITISTRDNVYAVLRRYLGS
jgi:mRNA interferase RelE/StbE